MHAVNLALNGRPVGIEVEPHRLLVELLRGPLGLTGTHVGCDTSQCGACTVLLDGQPVKSCTVLAVQADGCEVTTIEGLAQAGRLHPVQQAFVEELSPQCGFCTPGQVMAAVALLQKNPKPTREEARHAMSGNLCRCGAYDNYLNGVMRACGNTQEIHRGIALGNGEAPHGA